MKLALWILLLTSSICIGWHIRARRDAFAYTRLDVEMNALLRCLAQQNSDETGSI
ncbi:MAG: hypothetical protein K8J31_13250 [Anaerolineae bacterium]|jgi:hypothetical protein|nr:hypothetical protein [Anaerolineae bacterium]